MKLNTKDVNRDKQNRRFCWPTSQLILMLGILIGGRFWDFKCLIWNFLIWKQQNLHIKENDQHLVQLLPNKLVTPFITVLLVSINVFDLSISIVSGNVDLFTPAPDCCSIRFFMTKRGCSSMGAPDSKLILTPVVVVVVNPNQRWAKRISHLRVL